MEIRESDAGKNFKFFLVVSIFADIVRKFCYDIRKISRIRVTFLMSNQKKREGNRDCRSGFSVFLRSRNRNKIFIYILLLYAKGLGGNKKESIKCWSTKGSDFPLGGLKAKGRKNGRKKGGRTSINATFISATDKGNQKLKDMIRAAQTPPFSPNIGK